MKPTSLLALASLSLAFLALTLPAQAQTTVLLAEDNGYIRSGQPDTVQPIANTVIIRSHTGDFARKVYLKFDLSDALEESEFFSAAAITLTIEGVSGTNGNPATYDIYGIVDNDAAWAGTTITWNNAPKNNDANSGVDAQGTAFLGSFTFDPTEIVQGDKIVLSGQNYDNYLNWGLGLLGDFYDTGQTSATGSLVSFIITPSISQTRDGLEFYSLAGASTDASKPQLSYTVIPEPATVGWIMGIAVGALLLGRRLRRR